MTDDTSVTPPVSSTIGSFAALTAGLFAAASGLQPLLLVHVVAIWLNLLLVAITLGGLALMLLGAMSIRVRALVSVLTVLLGALMTIVLAGWTLYAALHGFVALLPFIAAGLTSTSTLLVAVSIPGVRRVELAREALLEG